MADQKPISESFPKDKEMAAAHEETAVAPGAIASEAKQAADAEQNMTVLQAIKAYPKAIAWSVLLSSTLIMEGYDLALLGNLYGNSHFTKYFGEFHEASGKYVISAAWQSGLSNGARAGEVFGLIIAGWMTDRWGYRYTTMANLVAMIGFIFILFFAPNVQVLVVGQILCGIPWGAFQSVTPAYASEVAPVILRPFCTTFINACWVIGQLLSSGICRATINRPDNWSWRIPYAVQWVWPIPILIGLIFAPESPWWLVRHNRREEARHSLVRLTKRDQPSVNVENTLAMIEYTNAREAELSEGTSYRDCFRGTDLRRTEIVVTLWIVQTLGGQNLMGYFTFVMVQAGLDPTNSLNLSIANSGLGLVGVIGVMVQAGLDPTNSLNLSIANSGLGLVGFTILIVVGSLYFGRNNASLWATAGFLILFTFVYDFTVGPVTYSLISELSSTRLKTKTIVLARAAYNTSNIFVNVMTNYQLSSAAWNWSTRAAFFWAGTCFCCVIWVYFRLPEPKGRTYAELDMLFEQGVSARKFAKTKVDAYSDTNVLAKKSLDGAY
ncbi:Maltose permease MAL31 like protein [Verticillium longisporum]|uniref:Maltose permease MAL31 like protein n=1 Tax=Verticillium longisporum TaxID=100787 RepID=A0A8I2ZJ95_VERLO|nr:Maltose permease MAL31 like protein [Verticillium longisporum]